VRKYKDSISMLTVKAHKKREEVTVRSDHVGKVIRVRDNGNGFDVKEYSNSSVNADKRYNLDYDGAEYLYLALAEIFAHGGLNNHDRPKEIKARGEA
jgi:hypothetical protein